MDQSKELHDINNALRFLKACKITCFLEDEQIELFTRALIFYGDHIVRSVESQSNDE